MNGWQKTTLEPGKGLLCRITELPDGPTFLSGHVGADLPEPSDLPLAFQVWCKGAAITAPVRVVVVGETLRLEA